MTNAEFINSCKKLKKINLTPAPGADINKCLRAAQEIANKTGKQVTVHHTQKTKTVNPT